VRPTKLDALISLSFYEASAGMLGLFYFKRM
jgi:hypothetical protein